MKKQGNSERWLQIGATMFESAAFRTLPGRELKLWLDLRTQFYGNNNGRLVVTLRAFVRRGWNSTSQLLKARDELLRRGLIRRTKYTGPNSFHRAHLYAFTDLSTAESDKHGIAGSTASHNYLNWSPTAAISDFLQEESDVSAPRKVTSPAGGERGPKTFPPGGKRSFARKLAPVLAKTEVKAGCVRFPAGGQVITTSTSVMSAKAGSRSGLNGSRHPVSASPAQAPPRAKRSSRAPRAKA